MDSQTITTLATGAGAFFVAIGAGIYAVKRNGLIALGKAKECENCTQFCSEHSGLVKAIENNTEVLNRNNDRLDKLILKLIE